MFYLLFIIIWIAIVTLAKDKIKVYIKNFFNITPKPSANIEPSHIFSDIHSEYVDFKNTLNLNVISIKDQLALQKPQKKKLNKKVGGEYKEIHHSDTTDEIEIEEEENDDELDFYQIFKKTLKILGKLLTSIYRKIKKFIKNNIKL